MLPTLTLVLVGGPILTPSSNPALRGVNLEVVGGTTLNIFNILLQKLTPEYLYTECGRFREVNINVVGNWRMPVLGDLNEKRYR